ncbi:MAG TPA: sigma-70 family RNA polymerase sigma factor [Ktedonobacteraceae bacterium]|nr:sigma-70 family RNA polymerase sigma factor [Ktedonobacteraceae bacterium]
MVDRLHELVERVDAGLKKPWERQSVSYTSEAALLEALRRKEGDACTHLFEQFSPMVYNLAAGIVTENDEAEDVLQESFAKVCRSISSFEGRSSLGTWLYRITFTTALMWRRKRQQEILSLDQAPGDGQSLGESISSLERDVSEQVLDGELRTVVVQAIADIPTSLRTAFLLRDIEKRSTSEAASLLGISESALKVRLHRARLLLRQKLSPYLDGTPGW